MVVKKNVGFVILYILSRVDIKLKPQNPQTKKKNVSYFNSLAFYKNNTKKNCNFVDYFIHFSFYFLAFLSVDFLEQKIYHYFYKKL